MTIILHGDCMDMLPTLPDNSIDAVVCDPPYHLQSIVDRFGGKDAAPAKQGTDGAFARASKGFMGKTWDGGDIAFRVETWQAIYRVLKPGAFLLAFSGSRTFCRVGVAIEDAGFIMHPLLGWIFGQGMPKGHKVNDPAWEGWAYGTQTTKPALEPILMAQKPFSEKTGTANVLRWGTGAMNIDGCRLPVDPSVDDPRLGGNGTWSTASMAKNVYGDYAGERVSSSALGRYPANVIHDGSPEVIDSFPIASGQIARAKSDGSAQNNRIYGALKHTTINPEPRNDSGSAARFFYCAKASNAERVFRCNVCQASIRHKGFADHQHGRTLANGKPDYSHIESHPTVKPLALMRYLCRLVTPPGGVVLDPFAGSGSTLQAAIEEGFQAIGIEREEDYVNDIIHRLRAA